ncbi:hypothetical protein RhiirA5_446156 [Rhizophagus irregularis]|uniref:Uncharacterized protein n=1 Tax=Rhizophagus irregularis TaxID=588596 RepID=A0A2N0NBW4_9GLOM|nr:hypothetical protein RhiirA5_446156 [Rhizophagus irregularis]
MINFSRYTIEASTKAVVIIYIFSLLRTTFNGLIMGRTSCILSIACTIGYYIKSLLVIL